MRSIKQSGKKEKYAIAVIGGGPAGIMAAISSAMIFKGGLKDKHGFKNHKVILIEKNESLGKKLLLTGGGRCNITNDSDLKSFLQAFGKKSSFLKPSFYNFDNKDTLKFFNKKGLEFKVENSGKVYPNDDKAISVLNVLEDYLREFEIQVVTGTSVKDIKENNGYFDISLNKNGIKNKSNHSKQISSQKIVLATGGVSYPFTGSTGEGLIIAEKLNHHITSLRPGLVPLKIDEQWLKDLSGLKIEDVVISFRGQSKKRVSYQGTILFTHFGVSGPVVLDLSREIALNFNFEGENHNRNDKESRKLILKELFLDIVPEKSADEIRDKFNIEFQNMGKTMIKNYFKTILPKNMIVPFLIYSDVNPDALLNQISRKEKNRIINNLKDLKIHLNDLIPLKDAMVTCGGVSHNDIHSKTMESKILPGIYFAGEILEFCGLSGGYNLQMAFSTGYLAGKSAADKIMDK